MIANTFLSLKIRTDNFRPALGNKFGGLVSPALKPIVLRMVYQVAKAVKIPIIGIGGVTKAEDVVEYMLAGASAVGIGYAGFRNPTALITIIDDLEAWCDERGIKKVTELIGAVKDDDMERIRSSRHRWASEPRTAAITHGRANSINWSPTRSRITRPDVSIRRKRPIAMRSAFLPATPRSRTISAWSPRPRATIASAIGHFDAAIAAEPQYASAHYNRAVALQALGQSREAIQGFARVCAIEPGHYDAHRALGFLWLAEGDRGRALDHFARTYELRRGEDRTGIAAKSLTGPTRNKLLHDAEQFRFLAERRRDRQRFEALARNYEEVAKDVPDEAAPLSDEQLEELGEDYNTAIHICGAPELAGPRGQRPAGPRRADAALQEQQAGAVWFDDLLTPPALLGLKRYLLESTIWHDFSHIGGFVASYLEDGLACPLLLQIADEIRGAFPELLGQASAVPGLGLQGAASQGRDRRPCGRCRRQHQFLGDAGRGQPQSRSRRTGRLPRAAARRLGGSGTTMRTRQRSQRSWNSTQTTT